MCCTHMSASLSKIFQLQIILNTYNPLTRWELHRWVIVELGSVPDSNMVYMWVICYLSLCNIHRHCSQQLLQCHPCFSPVLLLCFCVFHSLWNWFWEGQMCLVINWWAVSAELGSNIHSKQIHRVNGTKPCFCGGHFVKADSIYHHSVPTCTPLSEHDLDFACFPWLV